MKDPYLELQILSSELWNEKKSLDYSRGGKEITKIFDKMDKIISKIKELDFEAENIILKEIYK